MADDHEQVRHSYNRLAPVYAMLSDDSEKRFVAEAIEGMLRPAPGEVILEPGFGTGQALLALAELVGPGGRVAGIDISDGMVARTTERLQRHGLLDRADIRRGDATALPYPDASFDAVFMSFTLELFDDDRIPVVLGEVRRVLRANGRLCVACMSSRGGNPTMERVYAWSHRRFPTFVDCRPIDAPALLAAHGFDLAEVRPLSMWGLAVDLLLARPQHRTDH